MVAIVVTVASARALHFAWLRRPSLHGCSLGLLLPLLLVACAQPQTKHPSQAVCPDLPAPPQLAASASAPEHQPLQVDAGHMQHTVDYLASDALSGRYTLSPDIDAAAQWLSQSHAANGVQPLGQNFVHPYVLKIIKGTTAPTTLTVTRGKKSVQAGTDAVEPLLKAGTGRAQGEMVFVGYGLKLSAPAVSEDYNDLEGIDLKGKVAVLLEGSPASLDFKSLQTRVEAVQKSYDQAVDKIADNDSKALAKAHTDARRQVAKIFARYLPASELPADFSQAPANPERKLDVQALAHTLWPKLTARPMANYERGENWLRSRLRRLEAAGAVGAVVITGPENYFDEQARREAKVDINASIHEVADNGINLPAVRMVWRDFDRLVGPAFSSAKEQRKLNQRLARSGQTIAGAAIAFEVSRELEEKQVPNVLAWIPGTDLAKEIVVVGAHFDHIGREGVGHCRPVKVGDKTDTVCNGADDNASGTAAVLELARIFKQSAEAPRRSLAFVHFSGEEMGLLGSAGFAEKPAFPLENTVAMINIDMIGRLGKKGLMVGGLGTSEAWMPLLDQVGTQGLPVLYDAASTTRSDHAEFLKRNVPCLFFFTGLHEDYHQPTDETDKIDFASMAKITQLSADLLAKLAMGAQIQWSEPAPGRGLVPYLPGEKPETIIKQVNMQAEAVPTAKPTSTATTTSSVTGTITGTGANN